MIEILDIPFKQIEVVKDLWEKNRLYHEYASEYFATAYKSLQFEEKVEKFSDFEEASLKISIAKENNCIIGYCISTIKDGAGDIASLHVDQEHRGMGTGKQLVKRHLNWMREMKCREIGVKVSQENHRTLGFYRNLGFYPNIIQMHLKENEV